MIFAATVTLPGTLTFVARRHHRVAFDAESAPFEIPRQTLLTPVFAALARSTPCQTGTAPAAERVEIKSVPALETLVSVAILTIFYEAVARVALAIQQVVLALAGGAFLRSCAFETACSEHERARPTFLAICL